MIPKNRSLVTIEQNALISGDTRRRIVNLLLVNQKTFQKLSDIRQYLPIGVGAGIVLSIFFASLGAGGFGGLLALISIGGAIYGFFTASSRAEQIEQAKQIHFPCPLCNQVINLPDPWTCGNCKHENGKMKTYLDIPFDQCAHQSCSNPKQTALQCPGCHHHIVLDEAGYLSAKSYEQPYKYVARYTSDTSQPVPKKPISGNSTSFFDDDNDVFDD